MHVKFCHDVVFFHRPKCHDSIASCTFCTTRSGCDISPHPYFIQQYSSEIELRWDVWLFHMPYFNLYLIFENRKKSRDLFLFPKNQIEIEKKIAMISQNIE